MTVFLNLALLIVGTAATLSAFGGKTWLESDKPFLERITLRGWISLICLVLALALGAIKEFYTEIKDTKKEQESRATAQRLEDEANKKQSELKSQLDASNSQLKIANQSLSALKDKNDAQADRLKDAV